MARTEPKRRYTYADLEAFPDDNKRREIIDGDLIVTASPVVRHQRVAGRLFARLFVHCEEHGGEAFTAPLDVRSEERRVGKADIPCVSPEHRERMEQKC